VVYLTKQGGGNGGQTGTSSDTPVSALPDGVGLPVPGATTTDNPRIQLRTKNGPVPRVADLHVGAEGFPDRR